MIGANARGWDVVLARLPEFDQLHTIVGMLKTVALSTETVLGATNAAVREELESGTLVRLWQNCFTCSSDEASLIVGLIHRAVVG
jgi:hypothetical protein